MRLPIVAIVGRPNVGKSTLFNRMIKRKKAVVSEVSGVTRDRNYYLTDWNQRSFYLVDTGGIDLHSKEAITRLVKVQTELAMQEADLILFLIDFKVGPQSLDLEIARRLRKSDKQIALVVNKADKPADSHQAHEFNRLGLGEPWSVSAMNGLGVADLLDLVVSRLPDEDGTPELEGIKVAVVGRPNVGKSSFVNAILGQEKLIVSEIPGTTRDSIDTQFEYEGEKFVLIDTAGLRHKSKITEELEYFVSLRTIRAVRECEVAALLIEAPQGIVKQDLQIAKEVLETGKGLVLIINKWDLVEKSGETADQYMKYLAGNAPFLSFVPLLFLSAKTGQRVSKSLALLKKVYEERGKRIETSDLNQKIREEIERKPPPATKGRYIKIYYLTQVDTEPPEFVLFSNFPELLKENYLKFLEQKIREHFGFEGTPIKLKLKRRK